MASKRRPGAGLLARWWLLTLVVMIVGTSTLLFLARTVTEQATRLVREQARTDLQGTTSLTALFLDEQLRGVGQVLSSYSMRPSLLQALQRPGDAGRQELDRQMRELQAERTDVLDVAGIADRTGRMLAAPLAPAIVGADFSSRDWYRGVTRTGSTYVSKAFTGASAGTPPSISVATPVKDRTGRLVAVIVVGYTIADFQQYLSRFAMQQGVDITVTDQDGVVIAQPGPPPTTLVSIKDDPRVSAALAGRTGVTDTARDGTTAAYAPAAGLGWAVIAELPSDRVDSGAARLRAQVWLVSAALALLLAFSGLLLARSLRAREHARDEVERLASISGAVVEASPAAVAAMRELSQAYGSTDELAPRPGRTLSDEFEHVARQSRAAERIETRERAALAEAVHDDALQLVAAALLRIDSLQARVNSAEAESLEQIAGLLETAIEHLRQLIATLAPPDLADGLGPALRRLADGLFLGTRTSVSMTGPLRVPLSPDTTIAAYRILREALVNARKHAQASTVVIDLSTHDNGVVLTVSDDGVGADSFRPAPGHLGVDAMRSRAEALGAALQLSGAPGRGTTVALTLPRRQTAS